MEAVLLVVALLVIAAIALVFSGAFGGMFGEAPAGRRTVIIERPVRRRRVRRVVEEPADEVIEERY
jgi:hypothetical protein